jgi:hypothetical protein
MTNLEKLTSECTGIILSVVRVKGRLWYISDVSGINRKYLNKKMFRSLRFYRVLKLLFWTSEWMDKKQFVALGTKLFEKIWEACNKDYDRDE